MEAVGVVAATISISETEDTRANRGGGTVEATRECL